MPNTPAQFPNYDLPGAEWLSLAPNANVAIQGRRRVLINPPQVLSVVGGATQKLSFTRVIEQQFTLTSGIYLHYVSFSFSPSVGAQALVIMAQRIGFGCSPPGTYPATGNSTSQSADVAYDVGTPFGTLLTPVSSQPIIIERDLLILAKDIQAFSVSPFGNVLNAAGEIAVQNQGASNQYFQVFLKMTYTRLDGFTE